MPAGSMLKNDVPPDTQQAAREIYNIQHVYMRIGDHLEDLFTGINLKLLDTTSSLDATTVARLSLVTAFQYAEALADPQASEAVVRRMDWKYALHLPLRYPGISARDLCRFRQNLFSSSLGAEQLGQLLSRLRTQGLFNHAPLDPVWVLLYVCELSRLYDMRQAFKSALALLAVRAPEWLRGHARAHWYERYQTGRLPAAHPLDVGKAAAESEDVIADIRGLLRTLSLPGAPQVEEAPEIACLRRQLVEHTVNGQARVHWHLSTCSDCDSHRLEGLQL